MVHAASFGQTRIHANETRENILKNKGKVMFNISFHMEISTFHTLLFLDCILVGFVFHDLQCCFSMTQLNGTW